MSWPLWPTPGLNSSRAYQNHCLLPGTSAVYWAQPCLNGNPSGITLLLLNFQRKLPAWIAARMEEILCLSQLSCGPINSLPEIFWILLDCRGLKPSTFFWVRPLEWEKLTRLLYLDDLHWTIAVQPWLIPPLSVPKPFTLWEDAKAPDMSTSLSLWGVFHRYVFCTCFLRSVCKCV